ncbi:hypothetical protein ACI7YT_12190 [Microbacterium sp. M]|uniref:hypothetical protein n=1 Tax=Microbacterium sp. M TaxID=3377125 RepID=UPI00386A05B3
MDAIREGIEQWGDRLIEVIHDAVEDATLHGEDRMIEILETAVTKTGLERAERGGQPGRIDSGDMRDAISSGIWGPRDTHIEGEWGWLKEVLDYFLYQENGTSDFTAMGALQGSYVEAREIFIERLQAAGLRVS